MNKPKVPATIEQIKASEKIHELRNLINDRECAEILGIHRSTMYKRLESNNWKKAEINLIKSIKTERYA